jgi:osmotically-inducible protein OsmY
MTSSPPYMPFTSNSSSVPAVTQGTTEAERGVTAAIRRQLERDGALSSMAQKISVITTGSTVSLQGTVANDAERRTVLSIARHTEGVGAVKDQLDVTR